PGQVIRPRQGVYAVPGRGELSHEVVAEGVTSRSIGEGPGGQPIGSVITERRRDAAAIDLLAHAPGTVVGEALDSSTGICRPDHSIERIVVEMGDVAPRVLQRDQIAHEVVGIARYAPGGIRDGLETAICVISVLSLAAKRVPLARRSSSAIVCNVGDT